MTVPTDMFLPPASGPWASAIGRFLLTRRGKMALRNVSLAHCVASAWTKWSSAARRTYAGFFPPTPRITIKRVRTWHYRKMHPCIEPSNRLVPLSLFPSWQAWITTTSGYDFRKGQPLWAPKTSSGGDFGFDRENSLFLNLNSLFRRNNSLLCCVGNFAGSI